MGIEYELKFRADPQALQAIRQTVEAPEQTICMQTTYYDTPTGQLSARHYTLRCRLENDIAVCTLKAPSGSLGRGEWEVPCQKIEDAIEKLCKLGAPADLPAMVSEGLIPVCGARFTRIAKTVAMQDTLLELALDEGVLLGGGKEIPLCEVEVELKSGDSAACNAYARQLAIAFGLAPETRSKFRRALALYKGEHHV